MIFTKKLLIFCFLIPILIFGLKFSLVESANLSEVDIMLKKEQFELSKLKKEIANQTRIINKMDKKKYSLLKKQRVLDAQLKVRERELKIYNWNLEINKKNINKLTERIAESEKKVYSQEKILGSRLRTIYKEGDLFAFKLLFSSEDFSDLLRRSKYMNSILVYDKLIFDSYERSVVDFNNKKIALLEAKAKISSYKKIAIVKTNEIRVEKNKKKKFLVKLVKEKKNNNLLIKELEKSSKKLNQLISRLENKINYGEGLDIIDKKGSLLPPVKGKFLNKFGRGRDEKYNSDIIYNGVAMQVKKGSPVRSIFDGTVLYTGILDGYGNIIIIGHGENYHSLYGYLDEIISNVGKTVRSGQIIGRSGETGSVRGEALYFEMRYKGKPIEPTAWLSQLN